MIETTEKQMEFPAAPEVRETSLLAYRTIKENGLLSRRRFQVY